MKKILVIFGILWLAASYAGWASDVQVAGSLDKNQAQIDEEVSFTIRILGAPGNIPAPRLPAFEGFDSFYTGRTSQFTFVNGRSSSSVEFSYVLVPKVAGRFTLQPVEVWIEGKRFLTPVLEIEVMSPQVQALQQARPAPVYQPPQTTAVPAPSAPPVTQPTAPPPQVINDDNIFVEAAVDKPTLYPNEQIVLTYTLYTRYDTRYEGFEEEPSVSGFWIEDFPLERDLSRDTVTKNGKRYVKADIRKIALFPTAPADYTIQPGVLKVSVREQPRTTSLFDDFFDDSFFTGASFFARRVDRLLKPPPIAVKVRPFPETGKPASFTGAVGQFRISASVDKNEVKQNEPVTLKLVIEGEGNIETLLKPSIPELTAFKIYDGDSSSQLYKVGANIAGKKEFEMIFIPTEAGDLAIPPLEFSYFDPRRETYEILRTPPFPLRVAPSSEPVRLPAELAQREAFKKEIQLEAKDIRYIHEEWPSGRLAALSRLLFWGLALVNLLGVLLVGNGLLRKREEALFSVDTALRRRKLARSIAGRRVKNLKKLARSEKRQEAEQFLAEAEKVLSEYLSNKFNVSAYRFTKEWLTGRLSEEWGAEDPLLKEIRRFYDLAAETRFGRGVLALADRRQFLDLIERVIQRVEKSR